MTRLVELISKKVIIIVKLGQTLLNRWVKVCSIESSKLLNAGSLTLQTLLPALRDNKMSKERVILTREGITWSLTNRGEIIGRNERDFPQYQFWAFNPPAVDDKNHAIFVAVCDFAVACGMLRKLHVYTLL